MDLTDFLILSSKHLEILNITRQDLREKQGKLIRFNEMMDKAMLEGNSALQEQLVRECSRLKTEIEIQRELVDDERRNARLFNDENVLDSFREYVKEYIKASAKPIKDYSKALDSLYYALRQLYYLRLLALDTREKYRAYLEKPKQMDDFPPLQIVSVKGIEDHLRQRFQQEQINYDDVCRILEADV